MKFWSGIFYVRILLYFVLGIFFKTHKSSYVFLFASFLLDLVFLYIIRYVESISYSVSDKFFKFLKSGFKIININFNTLFLWMYISNFLGLFESYISLILFFCVVFAVILFSVRSVSYMKSEILVFRLAKEYDRDKILEIYVSAAKSLKKDGVDQWQGVYTPSNKDIDEHIGVDLYVLEYCKNIVCTACLVEGIDEFYEKIDGKWNTSIPYISIHKVATSLNYKRQNFARKMMSFIEIAARRKKADLRIDTHENNEKMKRFILSCGYNHCGVVYLSGTLKRLAYDKKTNV
ncbi:MAG: GNAT family N-acetyltransferase [Parvimonas sp.]|uniref:GNAT family N-acetyltransferase n=1 Tax=Parvimonas sp. TaxID=1944660 RepID=UPI0025F55AD7|nr:GNAT family N-acetyltransferase [Parvimonas sp.]MCI5997207.1 GNAT family N-acetyltransferase [Parvimonas sp.]